MKPHVWKIVILGLVYALLVLAPFIRFAPLESAVIAVVGLALASPFVGALFIWRFVRWLNHRDDPRHTQVPSDFP